MEVVQKLTKQLREILAKLSVTQQVLFGFAGLGINNNMEPHHRTP